MAGTAAASVVPGFPGRIKTSCNLYSFNGPLTKGAMTLEQVLERVLELLMGRGIKRPLLAGLQNLVGDGD